MKTVQKTKPKPPTPTKPPATPPVSGSGFQLIPLSKLESNPNQPRQVWDSGEDEEGKTKLARLAESIMAEGVLQPLVVTPRKEGFMIVCGERRFRAAKLAQLKEVPCVVKPNLDEKAILEMSITENLQRENLTPIDQAKAIKALMDKCGYTQEKVGKRLGLSVAAVNYKLSLLNLSPDLQRDIKKGTLTETQGRQIAQVVNKVEPAKRNGVMTTIKERLEKAKVVNHGKPLSTKDVRTVAHTTAKEHVRIAPPTAGKPAPKPTPEKPKPPTPKEKAEANAFAKALTSVEKTLMPYGKVPFDPVAGLRFAEVLLATSPGAFVSVRGIHGFMTRMLGQLEEGKRRAQIAKIK